MAVVTMYPDDIPGFWYDRGGTPYVRFPQSPQQQTSPGDFDPDDFSSVDFFTGEPTN